MKKKEVQKGMTFEEAVEMIDKLEELRSLLETDGILETMEGVYKDPATLLATLDYDFLDDLDSALEHERGNSEDFKAIS